MASVLDQFVSKDAQANIWLVLKNLFRNWYLLVIACIIGGFIGYWKIKDIKPTYSATYTFVLSTDQKSSGLSGLAAQLGFDGTTASSDNIFSGDNIIELFKSRLLIGSALLAIVDTPANKRLIDVLAFKRSPVLYNKLGHFGPDPQKYTPQQTAVYRSLISAVTGSFTVFKKDKKLIFYVINAVNTDPDIAYLIAKYVLNETSQYFIDTKTKVSANSVKLLKHEADSLARLLGGAYNSTANLMDRTYNLNPSISAQRSGVAVNQTKANAVGVAYTEVVRNLEIAKINLQKETPLYRIIDEPELPLPASLPNITSHIKLTAIFALIFMAFLLTVEILYSVFFNKK